jgi:hypothetical protein
VDRLDGAPFALAAGVRRSIAIPCSGASGTARGLPGG